MPSTIQISHLLHYKEYKWEKRAFFPFLWFRSKNREFFLHSRISIISWNLYPNSLKVLGLTPRWLILCFVQVIKQVIITHWFFIIDIVAESIKEAGVISGCDRTIGNLMCVFLLFGFIIRYNVATTLPESSKAYRPMVLKYVVDGKLKSNLQVTEAVSYLKKLPQGSNVWMFHVLHS